jgi:hypothetical protein
MSVFAESRALPKSTGTWAAVEAPGLEADDVGVSGVAVANGS